MKEIKLLRLFVALLLLFLLYNNLRADEKKLAQVVNNKAKQLIEFTPAKKDDKQAKPKLIKDEKAKQEKQLKESVSDKKEEKKAESKQVTEEKVKQAQLKAREEELARQRETELRAPQEEKIKLEAERNAKQAQRLKEIDLAKQEKQAKLKQATEEKAEREEQKRLEVEAGLKEKQQELALKQVQLAAQREKEAEIKQFKLERERKAREEELARQREEKLEEQARQKEGRLREVTRVREQREAELRSRQEEKLKLEAERKAQQAQLAAQREKETQAQQLKLEEERKAREEKLARQREERLEELARQEEERLREIARAKEIKQAQFKAHQEELARQKEERLREIARAREQREAELRSRQEEKLKLEAERKAKQAQLAAQREKEAEIKQFKLERERKAREEELARQREEKLEEEARRREEKLEEEARRREEKLEEEAREREERLERLAWEREQREAELRSRQEELAREREERLEELAWAREQREAELRARQEELVRLETERLIQEAELETQREEEKQAELRARQGELTQQREEAKAKINEAKKASTKEKLITEAMLKKQKEDQAKIEKIEKLWKQAKKLYDQEKYGEAIQDFQKIIELEGNPRIKYTPEAQKYIEKAEINMEQKKKVTLYNRVALSEREMVNEVTKKQVPPYLEPPQRFEQKEPTFLIEPPAIRKKLKATKITMDFDKVGFKSAIAFLAQESGINFVASQKVLELAPVVSTKFKDTALDEVIKYITKNLGLIYRVDKEVVWIAHPEEITNEPMETRIYYLNKGGGLFTEFSPMSAGTTETGLGGSSAQINKIYTIEDTLKEVIPWPADSKISYDKRLNALLVRNTPQNLQTLEDILYTMDVEPLQVLIEARFLEVDVTDTKELGVDWNLPGGDWQLKDREGTFKAGIGKDSGVDFSAFSRVTEGLNLTYKGMLTNSQFQAVLHALEESKKIKTLSCPRITTLNNQLATIKVVDEWIYPTRYEFEILQVPGQLPSATPTYEYKNVPKDFLRRDVGLILKVIPAVGADRKTINLSLIPEISEGIVDGFSYTGDVKLPKFTSRNLSTTVVVNSGDTVVLGGMIKESRTKTVTKVPVLGDIPLIGSIFKKNTESIQRKNLLIFVTAKVLSSSGEEVVVAQK